MVGLIIKEEYLNPFEILVQNFHLTILVMCENICFIALRKQQSLSDSSWYSMIKYSHKIENQEERTFDLVVSLFHWNGQNYKRWLKFGLFSFISQNPFSFFFLRLIFLFVLFIYFIVIESWKQALKRI